MNVNVPQCPICGRIEHFFYVHEFPRRDNDHVVVCRHCGALVLLTVVEDGYELHEPSSDQILKMSCECSQRAQRAVRMGV